MRITLAMAALAAVMAAPSPPAVAQCPPVEFLCPVTPYQNARFGRGLDLQGDVLAVGATKSGAPRGIEYGEVVVYRYDAIQAQWNIETILEPFGVVNYGLFGREVILRGNRLYTENQYWVYVFEYDSVSGDWLPMDRFQPSDGEELYDGFDVEGDVVAAAAISHASGLSQKSASSTV